MTDEIAQINAAINAATYRIDEIERTHAAPVDEVKSDLILINGKLALLDKELQENKQAALNGNKLIAGDVDSAKSEIKKTIEELKSEQQALLNKSKFLEIALHENSDSLRNDLINKVHTINEIKSEFKKELDLLKAQITESRNDLKNAQVIINDILNALQSEIKNTVTKEYISELYKKGGE